MGEKMKNMKMAIGLAIAALLVLACAGSASATELFKDTTLWLDDTQAVGAKFQGSLQTSSSAILEKTDNQVLDSCTGSSIDLQIEATGTNPSGSFQELTLSGCTHTTHVIAGGTWEVVHIPSSRNGLFRSNGMEVTTNSTAFGASCVFKSSGVSIGTLTGAPNETGNAVLEISGVISSTLCGSARLTANYTITSPTGLYVEA
jgi:hypothetical protein